MAHQTIKKEKCPHVGEMKITSSDKKACEICGETKNLRLCTSCGSVFCCESHKAHNEAHFKETGHPDYKTHACHPSLRLDPVLGL